LQKTHTQIPLFETTLHAGKNPRLARSYRKKDARSQDIKKTEHTDDEKKMRECFCDMDNEDARR